MYAMDMRRALMRKLLESVLASPRSAFYREHYKKADVSLERLEEDFSLLPPLRFADLQGTGLAQRLYTSGPIHTKVIRRKQGFFLFGRTIDDIGKEAYGPVGIRPLVIGVDCRDAVEFGLWCYEQNVLPLIGEDSPAITASLATTYEIDSIVGEASALMALLPELVKKYDLAHIKYLSLGGISFDLDFLRHYFPVASIHLYLWLPETGSIATLCPESEQGLFHPLESALLEYDGQLIVSKLFPLPTPLLRYDTGLHAENRVNTCNCDARESIVLSPEDR